MEEQNSRSNKCHRNMAANTTSNLKFEREFRRRKHNLLKLIKRAAKMNTSHQLILSNPNLKNFLI